MTGLATKKLHKTISCSHFVHNGVKMMQIPSSANKKWAECLFLPFLFSYRLLVVPTMLSVRPLTRARTAALNNAWQRCVLLEASLNLIFSSYSIQSGVNLLPIVLIN